MTRLVQLAKAPVRRVALVEEPHLRLLDHCSSIYSLAQEALFEGKTLTVTAQRRASRDVLDYDPIYHGTSEWRLLPAIDHPNEPSRCLVSGTGLTHFGSARERQAMHTSATGNLAEDLTDSMKMFRWGLEGGRPAAGSIGTPPEWFYKGTGTILRAHGDPLDLPAYADDGGEEGEIAGVYLIGPDGQPHRLGMSAGNEFSDHQFEKKNYLNLAGSKLRTCSLGPELLLTPEFGSIPGEVTVERGTSALWSKKIRSGEVEMCHSLQNIEHHHFKYEAHRRPGDIHIHFFGADSLSFGDGVHLDDDDVMQVKFDGFGRPLRNPLRRIGSTPILISVLPLG